MLFLTLNQQYQSTEGKPHYLTYMMETICVVLAMQVAVCSLQVISWEVSSMASAVSPASLAEDSIMTSTFTSGPAKKSWLEIRMVIYQ